MQNFFKFLTNLTDFNIKMLELWNKFIFILFLIVISCTPSKIQKNANNSPKKQVEKCGSGLLRVHPENTRYLTNDTGKALHFAGSDTYNLNHISTENPDFKGTWDYFVEFLDFMQSHNQNFLRLWAGFSYLDREPWPWQRTGPGFATDGKPKFDMTLFNQSYFDMLKWRLSEIQCRDLYNSIMIFGSYNLMRKDFSLTAWYPDNNINPELGSAFDPENSRSFFTTDPAALNIQKMLIRKFVDELNDYDCFIWEIMNETGVTTEIRDWYYEMVSYVRSYEAGKPKRHLVGMTPGWDSGVGNTPNVWLYDSPADWIQCDGNSELEQGGSASYTDKIMFMDTDHHAKWCAQMNDDAKDIQKFIWKAFCRGHYPQMLEIYRHGGDTHPDHTYGEINHYYDFVRYALGDTVLYSKKFRNLSDMIPSSSSSLCSTTYCLRDTVNGEYISYSPYGSDSTLSLPAGNYTVETFDVEDRSKEVTELSKQGGGDMTFSKPDHVKNDWVLYVSVK